MSSDTWTNDQFVDNCSGYYDQYRNDPAIVRRFEDRFQAEQQKIINYMPCTCNTCGQEIPTNKHMYPTKSIDTRYADLVNNGWPPTAQQYNFNKSIKTSIAQPNGAFINLPVNSSFNVEGMSTSNELTILFMFIIIVIIGIFIRYIIDVKNAVISISSSLQSMYKSHT